jgi:aminoglycoside phosphotransferase (APT) family kinase protein
MVAPGPAAGSPASGPLGEQKILAILKSTLPNGDRITGVHRVGGGHSNDTFLVEGIDAIMRAAPQSGGLMPSYDILHQYRTLEAIGVAKTGLPVPEVLGMSNKPSALGSAFFLMRRCAGESTDWKAPGWMVAGGPELRQRLSQKWISAVAHIHTELPTSCTSSGGTRTPAEEARYWLDLAVASEAPAQLIDILRDLETDPPPTSGPATCVHGDAKFANFLWTEAGDLTAVLDWEFAHCGEPLVDLGYLLGVWPAQPGEPGQMPYTQLAGWWSRDQIVEEWQRRTGRTAAGIERYEQLGMGQVAAIFARGFALYRSGQNTDPRLGRWERSLTVWLEMISRRRDFNAQRGADKS